MSQSTSGYGKDSDINTNEFLSCYCLLETKIALALWKFCEVQRFFRWFPPQFRHCWRNLQYGRQSFSTFHWKYAAIDILDLILALLWSLWAVAKEERGTSRYCLSSWSVVFYAWGSSIPSKIQAWWKSKWYTQTESQVYVFHNIMRLSAYFQRARLRGSWIPGAAIKIKICV